MWYLKVVCTFLISCPATHFDFNAPLRMRSHTFTAPQARRARRPCARCECVRVGGRLARAHSGQRSPLPPGCPPVLLPRAQPHPTPHPICARRVDADRLTASSAATAAATTTLRRRCRRRASNSTRWHCPFLARTRRTNKRQIDPL
jgi:hypothetical protein